MRRASGENAHENPDGRIGVVFARDAREEARIGYLIQAVESLKGAVFIRNGNGYDPGAAGEHLRMKLRKAGDRVRTAEDFIAGCATGSSLSGRAYRIRFPDGTTTDTAPFFQAKLREFDSGRHLPAAGADRRTDQTMSDSLRTFRGLPPLSTRSDPTL